MATKKAVKKTVAKKTVAKKAAVKKKSAAKKPAKKKAGTLKSVTLHGDHTGGVKVIDGGPHTFTIMGGPHMLVAPKGQKIGKIRIAKNGADLHLTFEK